VDYKINVGKLTPITPSRVSVSETIAQYGDDYTTALSDIGVELVPFTPLDEEGEYQNKVEVVDKRISESVLAWEKHQIYPLHGVIIESSVRTLAKREIYYNPAIINSTDLAILAWATYNHVRAGHSDGDLFEITMKSLNAPRNSDSYKFSTRFTIEPSIVTCEQLEQDRAFTRAMVFQSPDDKEWIKYQKRTAMYNGKLAREKWNGDCFKALEDVGYEIAYADQPYVVEHNPCVEGDSCTNDWHSDFYAHCKGKLTISNWVLKNRPELIHMIAWMCVYHTLNGGHKGQACPWMTPYRADRAFMQRGRSYGRFQNPDSSRGGICSEAYLGRAFTIAADFETSTGSLYNETDEFFEEWFDRLEADYKIKSAAKKR
tara:strand:+ start:1165 stop:2283 length:1119 start_codon:yes stop_codon:yes gene_type:complete